jgi:hypothetical protein
MMLYFYLALFFFSYSLLFILTNKRMTRLSNSLNPLRNWFVTEEARGAKLLHLVYEMERRLDVDASVLPQYKDYTQQLELLLSLHRRLGIPLKQALATWRESLIQERQKNRRLKRHRTQGFAQAIVMALMTWAFIGTSRYLLEMSVDIRVTLLCLGLPALGIGCYVWLIRYWERRYFKALKALRHSLTRLLVLKQTGLSCSEVLTHCSLDQLSPKPPASMREVQEQFLSLLGSWRKRGTPLTDEGASMLKEIDFLMEEAGERLMQVEGGLKLFVLMFFFLVPYLLYLLALISRFFIE